MADFLQALRMRSNFGSGGNPLGDFPTYHTPDLVGEYATRVLPLIHSEQAGQEVANLKLMNMIRAQHQSDEATKKQNPNIVFNPTLGQSSGGLKPVEKAKLDLEKQKLESTNENNANKLDFNREKLTSDTGLKMSAQSISKQRADAVTFKANHPNMQVINPPGSNQTIFLDPVTHEMHVMQSDAMTNEEIQRLKGDQAVDQINSRGEQSRLTNSQNNDERGANALDQIRTRGDVTQETNSQNNAARGANSLANVAARAREQRTTNSAKVMSPTQQRANQYNRAASLLNQHPEYKDYIAIDPVHKDFTVKPGTDSDTFHTINNAIYNNGMEDIELPSEDNSDKSNKTDTKKTDNKQKPTDSKYKVTVED